MLRLLRGRCRSLSSARARVPFFFLSVSTLFLNSHPSLSLLGTVRRQLTKYVSYIDPSTSVSNAPHPSPWKTRAAMHSLKLSSVLMFHMVPTKSSIAETRYTGLLPKSLAAVTQARPAKAETISGAAVRAVAEA